MALSRYHATMCGRYSLRCPPARIQARFGLLKTPEAPDMFARYNIAPSQQVPAVRAVGNERELVSLRWGLLPPWAKDGKSSYTMINARAETVATKPAYRAAFRQRRCLIPATGFFEWKQEGRLKQPYHFRMRDGDVFGFAGLWERWEGAGNVIESCSIIITDANDVVRPVHERMPVIIDPSDYAGWLDPDQHEVEKLLPLLNPYPPDCMESFAVSRRVNSAANDDPDCVAPI